MNVSVSVVVNPPQVAAPVTVAFARKVVWPRCSKYPVAVPARVVVDVMAKVPDKPPLKGIPGEAKTTGNAVSIARTDMMIGASIFILV